MPLRLTANSNRMQSSSLTASVSARLERTEGVATCMFISSLFHLLFIFTAERSRSHVPPGACQVSGNQSECLILPTHTNATTHKSSPGASRSCLRVLFPSFFPILSRSIGFFESELSATPVLMEKWNLSAVESGKSIQTFYTLSRRNQKCVLSGFYLLQQHKV